MLIQLFPICYFGHLIKLSGFNDISQAGWIVQLVYMHLMIFCYVDMLGGKAEMRAAHLAKLRTLLKKALPV